MTDRDKRTLMIGGIVVGVLLVGFLLFNLLGGGGGEEELGAASPRPTSTTSGGGGGSTSATPSLTPSAVLVLPLRDPFSAPPGFSVSTSTSTSSTGSGTGSSSTSSSSTSSGTGTGSSSTTSGATPPTQPGNGASDNVGGHTVVLLDTFTTNGVEQAQVEVDGTVYRVSAGENFGPNNQYRLQSVSGNCATFLYGDESFTLCVPQNK